MSARFGWQGFCLEHPDDWAPVALSGDRGSGYARLASPRSLSLQIRWARSGHEDLEASLDRYLDRLSRDARRKRVSFSQDRHKETSGPRYRYGGEVEAEGLLFPTKDGRVVFLESIGESTTARKRSLERARDSFAVGDERWSLLGLDVRVPGPLRVEGKEFVAGRTTLRLVGRGVQVNAERWGLAESLLAETDLQAWATNRLGNGWRVEADGLGLRGSRSTLIGNEEAIVVHQPQANQITLIRTRSRNTVWRPQWDWSN